MNDGLIQKMQLEDLDKITSNLQTDFDDFWNINILKSELENEHSIFFLIKKETEIVGFAGLWESVDDIHLTNIVIKKAYRGKRL